MITAAHCVEDTDPDCSSPVLCSLHDPDGDGTTKIDPDEVSVVLGRTTLSNTAEGVEATVQATSYRSTYNPNNFRNDVGYLVLSAPSTQTKIRIAGDDEDALWDAGSPVDVSGWGYTSENASNTVDTLRAATVEMISDATRGSAGIYGSDFHQPRAWSAPAT